MRRNLRATISLRDYLRLQGYLPDLEASDCWNPILGRTGEVADLVVSQVGRFECCAVEPGQPTCSVPSEGQFGRTGYVAVELDAKERWGWLLGFVPGGDETHPIETLNREELQSMDEFGHYLQRLWLLWMIVQQEPEPWGADLRGEMVALLERIYRTRSTAQRPMRAAAEIQQIELAGASREENIPADHELRQFLRGVFDRLEDVLVKKKRRTMEDKDKDKDKVEFLMDSLLLIEQTQGNEEQLYAFWRKNLHLIDGSLVRIVPALVSELARSSKEHQTSIANTLGQFGDLMQWFPDGNRGNNIELAITSYHIHASVFNKHEYPSIWAMSQCSLGTAYIDRVAGNRSENIELAIAAFRASLEVYTREAFPVKWARSQLNLGSSYSDRIVGNRKENIELAIAAYRAAMEVYTRKDFPSEWGAIQGNLKIVLHGLVVLAFQGELDLAYCDRIIEDVLKMEKEAENGR